MSSHALNSHNLISAASNHSPKSPNQQQQQQLTTANSTVLAHQQQRQTQHPSAAHLSHSSHLLSTFAPQPAPPSQTQSTAVSGNITAAAVAAVTQQQQQQHLQLLANVSGNTGVGNNNNNLMSSSLNAGHTALSVHERGLPPKSASVLHGSNMLLHTSGGVQHQQTQQQPTSLTSTQSLQQQQQAGMSTSLHSFDLNGVGGTTWNTAGSSGAVANSSLSPTTGIAPNHAALPQHRKCEVKLNAMP